MYDENHRGFWSKLWEEFINQSMWAEPRVQAVEERVKGFEDVSVTVAPT